MTQTKIQRLMAIKEEFARTQTALMNARKLEESAQTTGLATLLENDLDQAELILAAQDIMHKLQNMAEDLAKMNAQDLFPLVDKMKATFGQEVAHAFEATSQEAISNAMNTVRHAKDEMGNGILRIEGKMPSNDMAAAAAPAAPDMATDGNPAPVADDAVDAAMDDFGAADAAAGPDDEPLGRARKESVEGGKALNESVILESAGRVLIETQGLNSLISWVLNEAAAGMPEEHFRSFATSIAQKAASDPNKLAGWIGRKKHGMAAMAQLAEPTYTNSDTPSLEVMEGKTYKRGEDADMDDNKSKDVARKAARKRKGDDKVEEGKTFKANDDDDDDNWKTKSKDVERKTARKRKGDDQVDEGKTFKANDDDDDSWKTKSNDIARKSARKRKGDEKVEETFFAARAIAQLIESSIKRESKGNAAKAVKEAVAYLAGKNLVESDVNLEALVLEAFVAEYGMKPAAYSVSKLREFAPLSTTDKKNANSALGKMSGAMGADKTAGNKSVQTAMQGMDGVERSAANKLLNQMKKDGDAPKNAGEFAQKAAGMVNDDNKPGKPNQIGEDLDDSDVNGGWVGKVMIRGVKGMKSTPFRKIFPNGKAYLRWEDKNDGTYEVHDVTDESKHPISENINAAHWPVDTMGQYKGEPFSTDYGKLKANPTGSAKTEGGAPEPKVEEPKVEGSTAPEAVKSEAKPSAKPFEKKAAPKAKEPEEESDTDEDKK